MKKKWFSSMRRLQSIDRQLKLRTNPTQAELNTKRALENLNVKFIFQHVHFFESFKFRIVDFFLPDYNLNLEIDGSSHLNLNSKRYDALKDKLSKFSTIRINNNLTYKEDFSTFLLSLISKHKLVTHSQPKEKKVFQNSFQGYTIAEMKKNGWL